MEFVLFYIFKYLAIISAIFVVNARNPVHAVLLLILVFSNIASILLLLEAEFMALVFMVVYIGAIAVLFLFVVMMLNIKIVELSNSDFNYLPLNALVTAIIGLQISYLTYSTFHPSVLQPSVTFFTLVNVLDSLTNIITLGQIIFLIYFFPFLLTGLVLLVAMIGSIILTLSLQSTVRRQEISAQNSQSFLDALVKHS